jgi:hypothetical protein
VTGKDFITGHDQTAPHNRVRQVGTVAEFLDWFDIVRGTQRPGHRARIAVSGLITGQIS